MFITTLLILQINLCYETTCVINFDVCAYHYYVQMSEFINQKSSIPGKIPSGLFNSMFGFESGSWAKEAGNTKYLGLDGYFILLFDLHIKRYPLLLSDDVKNDVPSTWDPMALAR